MNLVVDDAVEVRTATRDNSGSRRQLGMRALHCDSTILANCYDRANSTERRQRNSHPST